jgi:hypothetical protein
LKAVQVLILNAGVKKMSHALLCTRRIKEELLERKVAAPV